MDLDKAEPLFMVGERKGVNDCANRTPVKCYPFDAMYQDQKDSISLMYDIEPPGIFE